MNNTLTNGLRLLELVANTGQAHGVTELARLAELPKSHVHRLLQSLIEARYLEQDKQSRYRISVGALRLGRELLRNIPIRRLALPEMLKLVRRLNLPLTLTMPFGREAISVAYITHDGNVSDAIESLGSVLSAAYSASGKLFLAYLPTQERNAALKALTFQGGGPNGHANASSLKANLSQIKQQGFSINDEESGPGVMSFAVPIRNQDGVVFAALGGCTQTDAQAKQRVTEAISILQQTVKQLEASIKEDNL